MDLDEEKCYIYTPAEPATKRRKLQPKEVDASWQIRQDTYHQMWNEERARIQNVIDKANGTTLDEIVKFLDSHEQDPHDWCIPAAFVLAGPDYSFHETFFNQLSSMVQTRPSNAFALLRSEDCPNFKALLKSLVGKVVGDESLLDSNGARLLDYDIQVVQERVKENGKDMLILAIQDSESFPETVLAELIHLLWLCREKLPITLIFGIATSLEIFQERLPVASLRNLRGKQFDVVQRQELLEEIFLATISGDGIPFRVGPSLVNAIMGRQRDHIQTINDFIDNLQYAYMCHFYSNPLSIFLCDSITQGNITSEVFNAIRNTSSFKRITEEYLEWEPRIEGIETIKKLLESDEFLFEVVFDDLGRSQTALDSMTSAVQVLQAARNVVPGLPKMSLWTLYLHGLEGNLIGSPILREFLLSVKKSPSDMTEKMISAIEPILASTWSAELSSISNHLGAVLKMKENPNEPIRSQFDTRNETLRTTVVAQKVALSRQKASLSEIEVTYSEVLEKFHVWLQRYFDQELKGNKDAFFSEMFIYNIRGPDRSVFTPKPRHAIERALSSPHDYLNCECCKGSKRSKNEESTLLGTQPPTALLYQLYLESGSTINVHDMWAAFNELVAKSDDGDDNESMFLFQQALAELSYLGMLKSTKKKADHVVKASWRGL